MDKSVPPSAAYLLDYIGTIEVGTSGVDGYDVLYGHHEDDYDWKLTELPIGEVLEKGKSWASAHGSSAAGRYQFMCGPELTLEGLYHELGLGYWQIFDANLQDRLGYHLLIRRGYHEWLALKLSDNEFMISLAKEWASLPVPITTQGAHRTVYRGESYYAGDNINKSLTGADEFEAAIETAFDLAEYPEPDPEPAPRPPRPSPVPPVPLPSPKPEPPLLPLPPLFGALVSILCGLAALVVWGLQGPEPALLLPALIAGAVLGGVLTLYETAKSGG